MFSRASRRLVNSLRRLAPPLAVLVVPTAGGVAFCGTSKSPVPKVAPPPTLPAYNGPLGEPMYVAAYTAISSLLDDLDHDDGSWGPIFLRLAWHAAGTYDKADGSGGSGGGATMRFAPESAHGANAGLGAARARLEAVKQAFPAMSYADIWSLAGVVAVQEMGGPTVPWRAGRVDAVSAAACTPDGRLPDADKKAPHLRAIFGRMGFSDAEIVALSGAHALGRCHTTSSGFTGPWTFSPTTLSNDYFKLLLSETWQPKKWAGPLQFEDAKTRSLMMLPSDMALIEDAAMKKHVQAFAKDDGSFFRAFASAFVKLQELGVKFPKNSNVINFSRAA